MLRLVEATDIRACLTTLVATVTGLDGPEAVRYDPDQDVYFIANFGARSAAARDSNGYIARVRHDGTIEAQKFMTGTTTVPLHQPRGMAIRGDTLWVADADGVHAFHRRTGAHAAFVDFTAHEPGFLNDVAFGPDGRLYITDTGRGRVYRITNGTAEVAVEDSMTGPPNGITWDTGRNRFLLATWGTARTLRTYDPATGTLAELDSMPGGRHEGGERESGIGNRESGIGNRGTGIGNRESGIGKWEMGNVNEESMLELSHRRAQRCIIAMRRFIGNRESGIGNREPELAGFFPISCHFRCRFCFSFPISRFP